MDSPVMNAKEFENRFTYHAPTGKQPEKYEMIRSKAHQLALDLLRMCPESRELSLAITRIEEAVFWANASIARRTPEGF